MALVSRWLGASFLYEILKVLLSCTRCGSSFRTEETPKEKKISRGKVDTCRILSPISHNVCHEKGCYRPNLAELIMLRKERGGVAPALYDS